MAPIQICMWFNHDWIWCCRTSPREGKTTDDRTTMSCSPRSPMIVDNKKLNSTPVDVDMTIMDQISCEMLRYMRQSKQPSHLSLRFSKIPSLTSMSFNLTEDEKVWWCFFFCTWIYIYMHMLVSYPDKQMIELCKSSKDRATCWVWYNREGSGKEKKWIACKVTLWKNKERIVVRFSIVMKKRKKEQTVFWNRTIDKQKQAIIKEIYWKV